MQKLSLIAILFMFMCKTYAQQSPHGKNLSFDCTDCHTTTGWVFNPDTTNFNHDLTKFRLEGQHRYTDCRNCHKTLVFSETKSNCIDCHSDMHNNTVGPDCAWCHNAGSWIVNDVTSIHLNSRFPLLGAHRAALCADCHISASDLEFQPLGIECIDCHRQDYMSATNPNHVESGISEDCTQCHKIESFQWGATGFNHGFFPLIKGHDINNCSACHTSGNYGGLNTDCISCHQQDFASAANPSHQNPGFTTNCTDCHTIDPDWKPADFAIHDAFYFPVFSGKHRGEWDQCSDCHTQPENYSIFDCTVCHEHNRSEMDDKHREVNGYAYNSINCLSCHPDGTEND